MLLCRCMNPDACNHNHTLLGWVHPYNISNRYNKSSPNSHWTVYMTQLCDQEEGYYGMFCGTCLKGYGSTAPFQCKHCAGAGEDGVVGKGRMSGLWFVYWVVLTIWYARTVWSSMPHTHGGNNGTGTKPTDTQAGAYGAPQHRMEGTTVNGEPNYLKVHLKVYHEAEVLDVAKVSHQ